MKEPNFEWALSKIKRGAKLQRAGWTGKGMHVELQTPDEHSKMTSPYIYLVTPLPREPYQTKSSVSRVPWVPSQGDLMANDWLEVEV